MKPTIFFSCVIIIVSFFAGCKLDKKDYYHLPATIDQYINVVIEIPAGTNHKLEYDLLSKDFLNKNDRVIDFLPYPGNYGFIPSTKMDKNKGGDGDALDVLVISEALPTGTVLLVQPLATLVLKDNNEIDSKIIAIPVDSTMRTIKADNFESFMIEYDAARYIIENWFLSYKGLGQIELVGWKDDRHAFRAVAKWKVHKDQN